MDPMTMPAIAPLLKAFPLLLPVPPPPRPGVGDIVGDKGVEPIKIQGYFKTWKESAPNLL